MKLKALIRSLIVIFLFGFFGIGALTINYLIFPIGGLFQKKENKKLFYSNVIHKTWKFFTDMMVKTNTIKITLANEQVLKNISGKIIVANHPSFIDIVILIGLLPKTVCIAKREIKKNVFMGNIVKSLYLINDEDKQDLLKESAEILNQGFNIVIFPTGTRTQEGETLKLHKGAAMMALHTKTDIVPIFIKTDKKFLAKNQKIYEASDCEIEYKITVNETIKIEDFAKQDLTEIQLRNRINADIKEKISS